MLNIIIFKNNNNICGFEVKNHTDPIVCSAVSVLSQSTVNAVEVLTEVGEEYELKIDEESGYLYYFIPSFAGGREVYDAQLLLRAYELSVTSLLESYSDYISVKIKEVFTHDKN